MITNLSDITIFSGLPKDSLSHIESLLKERQFKKNHVLMFENDLSQEVYLIRSGKLKVYRISEDREIILKVATPGEILGESEALSNHNYRLSTVEALENVSAWQIEKQDFLRIVEQYPSVLKNAYTILIERIRILNRLIRYLSFYDVRTRTANLITDLYYNFGKQEDSIFKIDLKINQSFLANMIGVTRESISKTLSDFQDEEILDIRNKYFYILNKSKLESICKNTEEIPELRIWDNQ
ncbi:CRP-like cAMP-activated global transcriptional regulator [Paenibacillus allorhizoplanae]|uniref:CRP-like cAMP-activated global transcriptional regulator n=1 Tax=Paenibacillus allorhizoplanae TaxID=2905648 RepID=A0ABM9CYP1_9BACL|nr:Crp/Fnr family transcriptional regulator [Paenibacillus allorhizoplanae]CAH1226688.1 CRP-like cAMP-activated global transcriptional regulator [Paenibacillus allorhizoplanae]